MHSRGGGSSHIKVIKGKRPQLLHELKKKLFLSDTEHSKLSKLREEELNINGDIELKGLLPGDSEKPGSDDENEEFELNVHGQR